MRSLIQSCGGQAGRPQINNPRQKLILFFEIFCQAKNNLAVINNGSKLHLLISRALAISARDLVSSRYLNDYGYCDTG